MGLRRTSLAEPGATSSTASRKLRQPLPNARSRGYSRYGQASRLGSRGARLDEMERLLLGVGIVVGLLLGLAGFALGVVGLMAMGSETPKLVAILGGVLLLAAAVGLITKSALALRKARRRARV